VIQGLYSFEANQVVHCMYEQTNLVVDNQSNSSMLQPQNIFSNPQDSPGQSQLLQVFIFLVMECFYLMWNMHLYNILRNFYSGAYNPEHIPWVLAKQ